MLQLTLLGSGNSAMLPVYGCDCRACERARHWPQYRRGKSSALLQYRQEQWLLDANAPDLLTRFPAGQIDRILLTHYHMDHVEKLFDLRWGKGRPIPVTGPLDSQGCDDLYKHPGLLRFTQGLRPFEPFCWHDIRITPLPLLHSKPTLGYLFERGARRLAYLTDTCGLPDQVIALLASAPLDLLLMDGSFPPPLPGERPRPGHNHLAQFCDLAERTGAHRAGALHIDHGLDCYLIDKPKALPPGVFLCHDGQQFSL